MTQNNLNMIVYVDLLTCVFVSHCRFGIGYHLTLVQNEKVDMNSIQHMIKNHIPNASLESRVGSEIDYILPRESSSTFKDLFTQLESKHINQTSI